MVSVDFFPHQASTSVINLVPTIMMICPPVCPYVGMQKGKRQANDGMVKNRVVRPQGCFGSPSVGHIGAPRGLLDEHPGILANFNYSKIKRFTCASPESFGTSELFGLQF